MVTLRNSLRFVGAALAAIRKPLIWVAAKAAPTLIIIFSLHLSSFCLSSPSNILFILVDDLAWSDLGSYGHPWHETPRIDSLGTDGMCFTQAYAPAPICSASRASILTGKTPARLGFEFVVKSKPGEQEIEPPQALKAPPFTMALDLKETTMAEHLLSAGYETAYFGKWHLNPHYNGVYNGWSPTEGPGQQGFNNAEEDFGSHPYSGKELPVKQMPGDYHPDGLTEKAVAFLKQDHDKPFFLMVSHFYVHTPIESPHAWLLKKYDAKMPLDIPSREQRVAYAAFVETLDHYVGQLLDGLEDAGLADSTLVVFFSDNGGHPEYVANKPLRGSKWNLYEGGIRVPMLVRWPGKVQPGSVSDVPVVGYDFFSTFHSICGKKDTKPSNDLDGQSLLPLFENSKQRLDRPLYWHFPYYHPEGKKFGESKPSIGINDFVTSQTRPHSAIRKGSFKLIYFDEDHRTELYDLDRDPSEIRDLSRELPEKNKELKTDLLNYLDAVHARRALPK
ncbi:MAG: sulfatase [Verrucomicrobia bacterium]|nr:sulfatase [Verrucomicrobiota bacterium]MDA1068605.1 sulfatase [Verrucomicrobiota bacterium]